MHETDGKRLVDIGSCGLHVVHNAFKAGFEATTWDLRSFMCASHQIFHESPARREAFTKIKGSEQSMEVYTGSSVRTLLY